MSSPSHYEALGLPPTASTEEIERRYQELARLYQIDPSAPAAPGGMAGLIVEAHRVLTNSALRAHYDSGLGLAPNAPSDAGRPSPHTGDGRPMTDGGPATTSAVPAIATAAPGAIAGDLDRTAAFDREAAPANTGIAPDPDRTAAFDNPGAIQSPKSKIRNPESVADRALAAELTRRGIASDEVRRIVEAGSGHSTAPVTKRAAVNLASPPEIPPSVAYEPKPSITLPAFREPTPQQRAEADRLLTSANVARRRGDFRAAEQACRSAVDLAPADGAALELYGDVLQGVGRVDDALHAYGRAKEADPARRSAEKKYAELMLRQNREIALLEDEYIPRSPQLAVVLSLVPGAGQAYNGEWLKAFAIFGAVLACVALLAWSNLGFPGQHVGISGSLVALMAIAALAYVGGIVDAYMAAVRGKRKRTGWEV